MPCGIVRCTGTAFICAAAGICPETVSCTWRPLAESVFVRCTVAPVLELWLAMVPVVPDTGLLPWFCAIAVGLNPASSTSMMPSVQAKCLRTFLFVLSLCFIRPFITRFPVVEFVMM